MQLNPYTVEQQLYRRAMKEKGVRPVRIDYRQASPPKTAAAQDSQDQEYQAPPSPERPRRPRERRPSEPEENGYDMVEAVRLAGLRRALKEASKRQKLTQDYSKKSKIASSPRVPRDAQPPIHQQEAGDIYDFTGSDSTATPLGPPNIRRPPSPTKAPGISNPGHDVMESYFNEPLNLDTEMHGVSATTQPPRPRSISIDSTASSHRTAVPHDGPDSGGSSAEDPSQETLISGDGRSKVVRQYKKRGTRGVLPASYKRIVGEASGNKNRDDNHRRIRGSSTPPPEDRRPGVARAKISSRAREPAVQDLFPQDDSDSGDEPQILGAAPPKPKGKQPARPKIYDLTGDDDIPEDNRIDYGLPPPERRRSNVHKAKRKAKLPGAPTKAPKRVRQGSPSRRGPRKPARPRLGIVEAVAYHKSVENKPLPTFVKVGARSALERRGRGKGSPSGKLFVLHEAEDTQDVLEELRKWRNGELPFGRDETVSHPDQPRYSQPRLPSPQRYGNSESSHRLAARAPSHRKAPPRVKRGQTKLLNFDFQRQKASEKRGRPNQPPPRPLAVVPVRDGFMTHRPVHRPQPAQFEREVPVSQRPRPTGIDDVYQNAWQRKRDLKKTQPSYSLQPVPPQARPTIRTSAPVVETSRSAQAPRIRKRAAKRVDIDIVERRQPPQQDLVVDDGEILDIVMVDDNSAKLQLTGLHPFGSKYSLNFDTLPLKNGTKFNAETFIGKGCLAVALKTPPSRFTTSSQGATYSIGGRSLSWGAYVDSVGTDFEAIMGLISDTAEKRPEGSDSEQSVGLDFVDQVYGFYGFVIKYISETLSFHDPRDVVSFSQRFLQSIENCCGRLSLGFSGPSDIEMIRKMNTRLVLQSNAFCMVMASQIFKLCSESPNVKDLGLPKTVRKIGRELLSRLLRCGVDKVRTCYDDQRRWDQFRRGIAWGSMGAPEADSDPVTADRMKRESQYYLVELWVVAIQTLNSTEAGEVSFWGILNEELHIDRVDKSCDVKVFERLWRNIFTLLPLHQFDESGVARPVNDERPLAENWAAVKVIAERPLQVYNSSKGGHFGTINDYIRMVYARCYHLITKWSWTNSDSLIPTLVKFFSDNGLANLNNEDDTGSPDFLLNLDKNPSTNLLPSDRCFHILLKVIVVGLRNMKATTAIERKKILRFVYRLLPIHGRQYLKEDPLRIDDLTALRNHHYLMETLYWAPPPECRPPLEYLRKTVDPETSHLKACDVSVRAWSNLVRFQLHSGESLEPLKEFMNWFDNLATATLDQYLNVRSEAEKQFKIAKQQQDSNLSDEDLEENIRINQKHLEALLNDLVKSLCNALASIPGQIPSAIVLLTQSK